MFHVEYHGYVGIDYWEYLLSLAYLLVLYLYFARVKNLRIKKDPEYAYLIWGLFAKVLGGVFFSLIYFYYYKGGDTIAYFYSAASMSKLAKLDPTGYFTVLFGENSMENRRFFNLDTGFPYSYVYFDHRTFFVIRCISPLVILALDSYLITTVVLASLSYVGIWRAYRTFVSYFPELRREMAIAFLFMPSCIFWGSAILKDTFTLTAVCLWIHSVDEIFYKKRAGLGHILVVVLSAFVIIMVKPYIFIVLFPVSLLWVFYFRVMRLRNALVKFVLLPMLLLGLVTASVVVLERLDTELGKFSLDNAIATIEITQMDMKRSEQYGENYFDIGEIDGTWSGVLSKFPVATSAGLFRPFLWESRSVVMALSGLENFWLLSLTLITFFRAGPIFFVRVIASIPVVLMSFLFALLFAFLVGVTTPNFGALVRFKIPLIPLFVAALYVVRHMRELGRARMAQGLHFDLSSYGMGTAGKADGFSLEGLREGKRKNANTRK